MSPTKFHKTDWKALVMTPVRVSPTHPNLELAMTAMMALAKVCEMAGSHNFTCSMQWLLWTFVRWIGS